MSNTRKLNNNRPHDRAWRGFTIVEVLVIIAIIAILATITVVVYRGAQERAADVLVRDTVGGAQGTLQLYGASNHNYPANIANTDYAPPVAVAVVMYTDASQSPVYSGLTTEQNAQLFLNTCNGSMPVESGGTTYNTSCAFNGNNLHILGTGGSNVLIHGPTIASSSFTLTCGAACTSAQSSILSTFQTQGGTFPITVISSGASLPAPTLVSSGEATRYCLEGRSSQFADITYHVTSDSSELIAGACPDDATLHYP